MNWAPFFLLFFAVHMAASQWYNEFYITDKPEKPKCKEKEGTSFTLLTGKLHQWMHQYSLNHVINRLSDKFPCVIRQYHIVTFDNSGINESSATTKNDFISKLNEYDVWDNYYNYNDYFSAFCNQSLLHGLKRALEISPAESFILTLTGGSVIDSNTQILDEIYNLLEEKKSQVFFIAYDLCTEELQEDVLREIASQSFGHFIKTNLQSIPEAIFGLDFFLAKPLNSSVRILNVDFNSNGEYSKEFDVTTSLTYMLITTSGNGNFTFTNPSGDSPHFEKTLSHITGYSYLVKFPVSGTWIVDIISDGYCSVRIWGFTGLESSGNCSNSDCHPYATCEEFGGYQECTCALGFQGDGSFCEDVDECSTYWLNKCNQHCINTIGSYNCSCYSGFTYIENLGCVDVDECLNHYCDPVAVCTNYYGSYTCTCPSGYNGNGKYCQIECQKRTLCDVNTDCYGSTDPFGCFDPCYSYTLLDEQWRLSGRNDNNYYYGYQCDYNLYGWYRFQGKTDQRIPEHCIKEYNCGTESPLWLNGIHPQLEDGTVNYTVCASWSGECCMWSHPISIRACPGGYYVYNLQRTPICSAAYCTEPLMQDLNCYSAHCAFDEECRTVDGVSGCHCKNNFDFQNGSETSIRANYLYPDLVCGSSQIKLSYSKCMLERMGYDTSSIHLNDRTCLGFIGREDKSYVKIEMLPRSGYCGAQLKVNETHLTYSNKVYLSQILDGSIQRGQAIVNFSCSYPLNMEISLWTAIDPFVSSVNLSIGGTGSYFAKMALYQDYYYSRPYEGSEVWLTTESMLYVGVIVEETQEFNLVLLMTNCYATPTAESWHPTKYYIIKDNCPNRNDPSISVQQNGVSLHGRFSFQAFKFIGNYDQVYLHCQIRLCDVTSGTCYPQCSGRRLAAVDNEKDKTLTLGPVHHKVIAPIPELIAALAPAPAPLSSSIGVTASLGTLILVLCFNVLSYNRGC